MPPTPTSSAALIERFTAACRSDDRVVAALLGGSHATGADDEHSDVDLYAIVADSAYDAFLAEATAFVGLFGTPIFCEPWRSRHGIDILFVVLADGTEIELGIAPRTRLADVHHGPYAVLVDHEGLLAGFAFPPFRPDLADQRETLRGQIEWFWHDLSHFLKATARGQDWWAFGALEDLRRVCVQLARLQHDFAADPEGYEKVDQALPAPLLERLRATVAPPDRADMLDAARAVVAAYQLLARPLAEQHGLRYPAEHERVMLDRLSRLT